MLAREACVRFEDKEQFTNHFRALSDWFSTDSDWVFRGHKSSSYELKTLLERAPRISRKSQTEEERIAEEKDMVTAFRRMVEWKHYLGERYLPYLAVMQHYGIPTALLDFSDDIKTSLFFALEEQNENRKGDDRAIWAVKTTALTERIAVHKKIVDTYKSCDMESFCLDFGESFFSVEKYNHMTSMKTGLLPIRMANNNPRITAQKGLFLMPFFHGDFSVNLNDALQCNVYKLYGKCSIHEDSVETFLTKNNEALVIVKIILPDNLCSAASAFLGNEHITETTMFPDMYGMAREVKRKFKFSLHE